ncbi:MAG: DUF615 domain-containing protein [Gammaproteobacteria bacterium]|nr:DUF615 domain-containing protein [Gammaproteobacteria bacterium]
MIDQAINDDEQIDGKSKSQIKREMQALRDLGSELTKLSVRELEKLSLDERLHDAVLDAQRFKKEALRRQLQRIGVLLRDVDVDAIRDALTKQAEPHQQDVQQFHQLEQWRDALIAGRGDLLTQLISQFPDLEPQHLRQLVRNAQREAAQQKPPRSSRLLFKYLRELTEQR